MVKRRTRRGKLVPDMIDLYDDLLPGLDRLAALAELLASVRGELDPVVLGGIGALLKDVEEKMRKTLEGAKP